MGFLGLIVFCILILLVLTYINTENDQGSDEDNDLDDYFELRIKCKTCETTNLFRHRKNEYTCKTCGELLKSNYYRR